MHAIKSQARKHAWNGSHKGAAKWVPYADRIGHRRAPSQGMSRDRDIEEGGGRASTNQDGSVLSQVHSEGCVTTLGELKRGDEQDAHPPPRSSTEPSSASPTHEKGKHSTTSASDDTMVGSSSSSGDSGGIGQALRFRRKDTTQSEKEAQASDLSKSKSNKSRKSFKKEHIPVWHQFKCVFWSWPNLLLVCVPVGIALAEVDGIPPIAIFLVNFLAIIPLAGTLSYATEELAMRVGETLGGLLNASFGNATELIVAIIALVKGEITIVQTSLVGSMLSNLLLVLGMCFALGGYNRPEQHFNVTVAQTACSLLILAGASLIIPTAFVQFSDADNAVVEAKVPQLSRGTAIILLFVYACYLFFQLRTHVTIYNAPSEKVEKQNLVRRNTMNVEKGIATMGAASAAPAGGQINAENMVREDHGNQQNREDAEEEEEQPNLSLVGGLVTLCGATALIGVCSEFVVDNISEVASQNHVPLEFIGLILLPIVGNAAEHATAVTVAIKDKMDLSIGVAVGSSLQIALLVIPLSVVIGWIIGPVTPAPPAVAEGVMTLNFDGYVITILFVSILLVNYLIQDGKSHWLEGVMLMTTYIIIAVSSWFYPDPPGLAAQ